ncbi:3-isopropylmalate/(R)-2-methylmalate dehydratase small subunit [Methylacidimicrobium tartarophylax]|uniref:3-isopropylmalate dehydratase n=1 Tax=Methylacidimicrobium tartarophylax TaxID=1041768 RepID=A0A5E6M7Y6_9BACT|nr:3-isopropylmalate/(R)-2-methylmalate dehydratase small subunit [Methylacidimicrobium tartarophylax]
MAKGGLPVQRLAPLFLLALRSPRPQTQERIPARYRCCGSKGIRPVWFFHGSGRFCDCHPSGTAIKLERDQAVSTISGPAYVVGDNIDTDQIIPAQYLMLVPTVPGELRKLGSYAFSGLPDALYPKRFVAPGEETAGYPIVVAGRNFGCGSSREHAPIALAAAGCRIVIAESYARIFFRNSVSTGVLFPYECAERLCEQIRTGDPVEVDLLNETISAGGVRHRLKSLGDVRPVIEAGGLFQYARKTGMVATP